MTPSLLHCLWKVIEEAPHQRLLELDESSLVAWLLQRIDEQKLLLQTEKVAIADYLQSHHLLIREIAETHRHTHCPLGV